MRRAFLIATGAGFVLSMFYSLLGIIYLSGSFQNFLIKDDCHTDKDDSVRDLFKCKEICKVFQNILQSFQLYLPEFRVFFLKYSNFIMNL